MKITGLGQPPLDPQGKWNESGLVMNGALEQLEGGSEREAGEKIESRGEECCRRRRIRQEVQKEKGWVIVGTSSFKQKP